MSKEIKSFGDLLMALAKHCNDLNTESDSPQSHDEFLAKSIERTEAEMRACEITLAALKATPPVAGAKLAEVNALMPKDPSKHGVLSVVTYGLEDGSFLVIGTDHLTQWKTQHTTPNCKGVEGQIEAVRHELAKQSVAADEALQAQRAAAEAGTPDPVH